MISIFWNPRIDEFMIVESNPMILLNPRLNVESRVVESKVVESILDSRRASSLQ